MPYDKSALEQFMESLRQKIWVVQAAHCTLIIIMRASRSRRSRLMSPRPDLGPKPRLGYAHSRIERAAERRRDTTAFEQDPQARAYAIGGEMIVLKNIAAGLDPLFTPAEARRFEGSA